MSAYLKTYPADDRNTPVQYVCIHPIVWNDLMNGETIDGFTRKQHEPACLANDYEFDSPLHEICVALGWQGGTVHQVIEEIKRLRAIRSVASSAFVAGVDFANHPDFDETSYTEAFERWAKKKGIIA